MHLEPQNFWSLKSLGVVRKVVNKKLDSEAQEYDDYDDYQDHEDEEESSEEEARSVQQLALWLTHGPLKEPPLLE